ncbi:MAG TPA: M20 family metallopeptidase [Candidimonas sp.]|nr:M20 family metallopeptidase [Candidimonas sp.]
MTNNTQSITSWLASQQDNMLGLLEDLVNIDSNSYDKPGVINVFKRLETFFNTFGLQVTWHEHEGIKNAISVEVASQHETSNKPILLMGHCDTVYPKGETQKRPYTQVGDRAYGPGVADMKAGIAMNAFILAAHAKFGGTHSPLIGLFTNDEEIGSPTSKFIIEEFAKKAGTVFNSEPGRANGDVVTGRKGGVFFELEIFGKAAHSGANFSEGISAINEMAHKIIQLDKLTDLEKGVTVNVGLVSGGQSVNTTAPYAKAGIDLRIFTLEDREKLFKEITAIAETNYVPGTRSELKIIGEFRPFVKTPASNQLYELYRDSLQTLGHTAGEQFSGGCADSGITSSLGCTTVCATGPVGGKPHTLDEYIEIDTFVPRAQAIALTISRLPA